MTKTVLMGVRVFALDGDSERKLGEDRPKNVRSIQLLIHKDDAEAWTYANELGKIRMAVGNDDDYKSNTAEDGSNLAAKDFVTWLEDHRRAKEEAIKAEAEREEPAPVMIAPANPVPARKNGFEMLKYGQDGRLYKYWIEPGKLPQIIEFTDPEASSGSSSAAATPATEPSGEPLAPVDDRDEDYSYLNGEDSPFYQPPSGQDPERSAPGF
jgi:pilus assembly protein CpaB